MTEKYPVLSSKQLGNWPCAKSALIKTTMWQQTAIGYADYPDW